MLGKTEGGREDEMRQRMRWLDGITDSTDMSSSKPRGTLKDREAWSAAVQRVRHDLVIEQQHFILNMFYPK